MQVDRWTMAMLFEHSVVTWVAFCSTRIGRGFDNEFSGTGSSDSPPRRLPFELASIFKGVVSIVVAQCSTSSVVFNRVLF